MSSLQEFSASLNGFATMSEAEVVKAVMWWAQHHEHRISVDTAYLRSCYERLHRVVPKEGFASVLNKLSERKPPQVIPNRGTYKLEQRVVLALESQYGRRDATVRVDKLLSELPSKLVNPLERSYLEEAMICFRHKAFRAAVVMTWNVAYDHICNWLLADQARLAAFNMQMAKTYARKNYPPIASRNDFEEPKESEVLQVLSSCGLINGGTYMILKEKLDRRNKAAHPTGTAILQPTAEDVIIDLIENVVMKLV